MFVSVRVSTHCQMFCKRWTDDKMKLILNFETNLILSALLSVFGFVKLKVVKNTYLHNTMSGTSSTRYGELRTMCNVKYQFESHEVGSLSFIRNDSETNVVLLDSFLHLKTLTI